MASKRLNKWHRDQIFIEIMRGKFEAREEAVKAVRGELALMIYEDIFRENKELLDKIPDSWAQYGHDVYVRVCGEHERFYFPEQKRKKFPSGLGGVLKDYGVRSDVGKKYAQMKNDLIEIEKERRQIGTEVRAMLNSATTANKLCEKWPAIASIVEKVVAEKIVNLPAINIDKLNEKLGLVK